VCVLLHVFNLEIQNQTRSSSGDEIANMNFLRQHRSDPTRTIKYNDSRINSSTDIGHSVYQRAHKPPAAAFRLFGVRKNHYGEAKLKR